MIELTPEVIQPAYFQSTFELGVSMFEFGFLGAGGRLADHVDDGEDDALDADASDDGVV